MTETYTVMSLHAFNSKQKKNYSIIKGNLQSHSYIKYLNMPH